MTKLTEAHTHNLFSIYFLPLTLLHTSISLRLWKLSLMWVMLVLAISMKHTCMCPQIQARTHTHTGMNDILKNWGNTVHVAWIMHAYSLLSSKCMSLYLSVGFCVCFAFIWDLRSTPVEWWWPRERRDKTTDTEMQRGKERERQRKKEN